MNITVNGEKGIVPESETLFDYLQRNSLCDKQGIAIALNETVIPRSEWKETALTENDSLIIIKATQGG